MDPTASSFSTRSNAKRAAEQMIAKGTALAVDYNVKPSNGRFEIVDTGGGRGDLGLNFVSGSSGIRPVFSVGFVGVVCLRLGGLGKFNGGQFGLPDEPAPAELALSEPAPVRAWPHLLRPLSGGATAADQREDERAKHRAEGGANAISGDRFNGCPETQPLQGYRRAGAENGKKEANQAGARSQPASIALALGR
jgi:hypothetical protein